jgi:hypothetical protein
MKIREIMFTNVLFHKISMYIAEFPPCPILSRVVCIYENWTHSEIGRLEIGRILGNLRIGRSENGWYFIPLFVWDYPLGWADFRLFLHFQKEYSRDMC